MSKEVLSAILAPTEQSDDADFGVPFYIANALNEKHLSHPWRSETYKCQEIGRILRCFRTEIDAWRGGKFEYDVVCPLAVSIHPCCQSHCMEDVTLKAMYGKNDVGDLSLFIMLPDETVAK